MNSPSIPLLHRLLSLAAVILLTAAPGRSAEPPPVDGNGFFLLNSGESDYYGFAPGSYNPATPISLFVWMHGCGGQAYGDMFTIAPFATRANQSYVAISLGGRDGQCWDVNTDAPKVLAAIRDVTRYFNIDPRKVYLGGYSSGGDMTYRVGFENAELFAGLLAVNSDPFRDTGSSGPELMAAASWKINVAHLLHSGDAVYPSAGVRANLATLAANGFPVAEVVRLGTHFDPDNGNFGTNYDIRTFLLPYLDAGWTAPRFVARLSTRKSRLATAQSRIVVRGTSENARSFEFKVPGKKFRSYRGDPAKWKIPVRLKPGRNVLLIRAEGNTEKPTKLRVIIQRQ